jgi:hypothetical protein
MMLVPTHWNDVDAPGPRACDVQQHHVSAEDSVQARSQNGSHHGVDDAEHHAGQKPDLDCGMLTLARRTFEGNNEMPLPHCSSKSTRY